MKTETTPAFLPLPCFLSGELLLSPGSIADYRALERFHYRPGPPATFAEVWIVKYIPHDIARPGLAHAHERVVAAAVLSFPTLACHARERALHLERMSPKAKVKWVNRNVRTISRVVVHPQFRSLGLASALVRCILYNCKTRYTEALAVMGRVHPFFQTAGMTLIDTPADQHSTPWYYLYDRHSPVPTPTPPPPTQSVPFFQTNPNFLSHVSQTVATPTR